MDDSQSSDVFTNSGDFTSENPAATDAITYESLVSNTKISLSKNVQNEVYKSTFYSLFTSLLQDCDTCISQSLDLVIQLLVDTESQLPKLCEYMEDTICLLQLLSNFIKNVIELVPMPCCNMKTFPRTTGRIIMCVYTHCKDSESLYGNYLKAVEKQLKDLFRTCHDLQLTYLMVLEKHFIFDLTEEEELQILIEALDINLNIGEIVQTLDVKTMAEQWKAYTMICEKHSTHLMDRHIYQKCSKALCKMIESNITSAITVEQDEKIVLRSLKVASFTIKILMKICFIFRHATAKNHEPIMKLLLYIHLNNCAYLELTSEKSPEFKNQMNTNISNPIEMLLKELLMDEKFFNDVLKYEIDSLKTDDKMLGYIMLIVSITRIVWQQNDSVIVPTEKLINCIFRILPFGHIWFNMSLKFPTKSETESDYHTNGLYEHMLTHTLVLTATLNSEDIIVLEQRMYDAVLGTDYFSALFSSNLWVLLSRVAPRQFVTNQLTSLCKTYQKLENHKLFPESPQHVHLSYVISKIFEAMHSEDQMKVYKQFSVQDENNTALWSVLKISTLPMATQNIAMEKIVEKLNMEFQKLFSGGIQNSKDIYSLIKTMKLAATCFFTYEDMLEENIIKAWMKACPNNNRFILSKGVLNKRHLWYLDYIEALVALTNSMRNIFDKNCNLPKILHVVSNMIEKGNTELKLVLMNLLSNSSIYSSQQEADSFLVEIFKRLLQEGDNVARNNFLNILRKLRPNSKIDRIVSEVINEDLSLQETWNHFINVENNSDKINLKEQLMATLNFKYTHKCVEIENVIELSGDPVYGIEKKSSQNFDFADIDTLFDNDNESDSEPACKKAKLNTSEIEEIITRLENDTSLLSNVKENVITRQYEGRIRDVCEKLKNIID